MRYLDYKPIRTTVWYGKPQGKKNKYIYINYKPELTTHQHELHTNIISYNPTRPTKSLHNLQTHTNTNNPQIAYIIYRPTENLHNLQTPLHAPTQKSLHNLQPTRPTNPHKHQPYTPLHKKRSLPNHPNTVPRRNPSRRPRGSSIRSTSKVHFVRLLMRRGVRGTKDRPK